MADLHCSVVVTLFVLQVCLSAMRAWCVRVFSSSGRNLWMILSIVMVVLVVNRDGGQFAGCCFAAATWPARGCWLVDVPVRWWILD